MAHLDDFSPGLETLFEGVDLPPHIYIKQRDSPTTTASYTPPSYNASPSPSSSANPSPEHFSTSPRYKSTSVEKWDSYHPTTRLYFPLYDQNYQLYEMDVRTKIDKLSSNSNDNFSPVDEAYILYRQNQFELEANVPALPPRLYIQTGSSFQQVDGCYFHIYAVKQTKKDDTGIPIVDNEDVAELIQHLSAREKKEVQIPPPIPVMNGQAIFSRLQFKSATLNNARTNPDIPHQNQQYYRLVLSLIVKVEDSFHFVLSKISPRLILRGRNPGNFQHSPTHEVPALPATAPVDHPNHSRQSSKRQKAQDTPSHQPLQLSPQQKQPQPQPQPQPQSQPHPQVQAQASATPQLHIQPQHLQPMPIQQLQLQQQMQLMQQQQQQQQQPIHLQQQVQLQLQHELIKQHELQQYLQLTSESDLTPQIPPQMLPQSYQSQPLQLNAASVPGSSPSQPMQHSQSLQSSQSIQLMPMGEQPDQPLLSFDDQPTERKSQKRAHPGSGKGSSQPPIEKDNWAQSQSQSQSVGDGNWSQSVGDGKGNIFLQGKVGINTLPTEEALTVHGNVLVTGNYLKPSDQRVKSNIKKINGRRQLETIENIQLYEYDLKHEFDKDGANVREIGVLAQELRKVLPSAVQVLQNVTLADGTVMPELLVVQDRALLYENIGATKELGAEVRSNQENLSAVQKRSQDLKTATHRAFTALGKSLDYLLTEAGDDSRDDIASSACYCTLFGLGPAWTVYFLGFLLPPLWLFGVFYISSFQQVKKLAGFFSAVTLILYIGYIALLFSTPHPPAILIPATLAVLVLGLILLCGPIAMSWGQKKARRRYRKYTKKKVEKDMLRKELGEVNEALEEV